MNTHGRSSFSTHCPRHRLGRSTAEPYERKILHPNPLAERGDKMHADGVYRSRTSPTARPGDRGMPLGSCSRKGHGHPFLPREVPFGIGGIVLARVFRLFWHMGAEEGHDLPGKQ